MISLTNVGKRYRLVHEDPTLVKSLLHLARRRRVDHLWALKDVSFDCAPGETLGIIGRNGSGKTTLLRLLAGVTAPTEGRLRVQGRVAPLIGVGVGFNGELSGQENAFVNGRMLGLSTPQIQERFDSIVAFSELESFLDTPVKYYSSGMFLRLAFAVAIHVEPQILLVDELLAVGDLAFQAKCLERMRELRNQGTSIVLVTHSMDTVHRMCERAIVLNRGRVAFDGPTEDAINAYHGVLHEDPLAVEPQVVEGDEARLRVVGGVRVGIGITDPSGRQTHHLRTGESWEVRTTAHFDRPVFDPVFGVSVSQPDRGLLYVTYTGPGDYRGAHGPGQPLDATVRLRNRLLPGTYTVRTAVLDPTGTVALGVSAPQLVTVTSSRREIGVVDLEGEIRVAGVSVEISGRPNLRTDGAPVGEVEPPTGPGGPPSRLSS